MRIYPILIVATLTCLAVAMPAHAQAHSGQPYQVPAGFESYGPGTLISYGGYNYVIQGDGTMLLQAAYSGSVANAGGPIAGQPYQVPADFSGAAAGSLVTYGGAPYVIQSDGTMLLQQSADQGFYPTVGPPGPSSVILSPVPATVRTTVSPGAACTAGIRAEVPTVPPASSSASESTGNRDTQRSLSFSLTTRPTFQADQATIPADQAIIPADQAIIQAGQVLILADQATIPVDQRTSRAARPIILAGRVTIPAGQHFILRPELIIPPAAASPVADRAAGDDPAWVVSCRLIPLPGSLRGVHFVGARPGGSAHRDVNIRWTLRDQKKHSFPEGELHHASLRFFPPGFHGCGQSTSQTEAGSVARTARTRETRPAVGVREFRWLGLGAHRHRQELRLVGGLGQRSYQHQRLAGPG